MPSTPEPLKVNSVLQDRFEIVEVLGRGGFGIVYLVRDRKLGDLAVVKELAPANTMRSAEGVLSLEALGSHQAHHLRQRFLEEARLLGKMHVKGIPGVRAAFGENGTAYYVIEHLPEAASLEEMLEKSGRMDPNGALDILYQLFEILEMLHAKGILHRDIKPSNVLISSAGEAHLIDFGSAREWHADLTVHHTVLFTPGYAPLEQLSPRGRRGPATDIYALSATVYHMLTGGPPPDAAERAHGVELPGIRAIRPEVERPVAEAIESGLAMRYEDRPQSIQDFRHLLVQAPPLGAEVTLAELDDVLVQLKQFGFDRRACPSCGGVLEEPKPLKKQTCPVCRRGLVKMRELDDRVCPICRAGILRKVANSSPLAFCPCCSVGELTKKRVSFLAAKQVFDCGSCKAKFESIPDGMTLVSPGSCSLEVGANKSFDEWRAMSGRSSEVWKCDGCEAQFDGLKDGRRKQVVPKEEARALYPEEWARIAMRLSPSAGNAFCEDCHAEFDVDGDQVSLIAAHEDPFEFAERYAGRLLNWEDLRWLGVGKESPKAGYVCYDCGTELDQDGEYLRLVRTENPRLIRHVDEPKTLEDWHRLARGLPEISEEVEFRSKIEDAVVRAYVKGEIGFDVAGQVLWNGQATRLDDRQTSNLVIRRNEITFGGMLRKWRSPFDAVLGASAEGHVLSLTLSGVRDPVEFDIEPVELTAALKSGKRTVELGAGELAERVSGEIEALRSQS